MKSRPSFLKRSIFSLSFSPNRLTLDLILLALCLSGAYSEIRVPLKLSIQRAVRTESGVNFVILVENSGPSSIFLEETLEGNRDPYAINIEQLQTPSTWKQVGPRRDVPPVSVFELKTGEKVEKTITVSDPYVDLRSDTRQEFPIRGKHRATIRYFLSKKDWIDFFHTPQREPRLVNSQVFSIPDELRK